MAIGWLTVLQMVPWADVISNSPKVAEGARKLWNTVGKKSPAQALPPDAGGAPLQARIAALEAAADELHQQMLASSGLLKTLAEQNAQLIQRIELFRLRLWLLAAATMLVLVIATAALWMAGFS